MMKRFIALFLCLTCLTGCSASSGMSYDNAQEEVEAMYKVVNPDMGEPKMDLNALDEEEGAYLDDIDKAFPMTYEGGGELDIEIASVSEFLDKKAPDDFLRIMAEKFNGEGLEIGGKKVSVSLRRMSAGEVVTYMTEGGYRPDAYIPSNEAWGMMLDASGIKTHKVKDRIAGGTAGILISKSKYDEFISAYGEASLTNILDAAIKGDLVFAYTNPYTSSTGLNILSSMLYAFDPEDPLSDKAAGKLIEYQKDAPSAAYTTAVLRSSAKKGIIDAMVMEEQAYINSPELKNYVYFPAGIRHDHPVYTFDYVDPEKEQAVKAFADYCCSESAQRLASDRGFNLHDDYKSEDTGFTGADYLAAQSVWKTNKNGGRPVIAVFVADTSSSMAGDPISSLKNSLAAGSKYISSDNYIGLVSYNSTVTIEVGIDKFDPQHRALFTGAAKGMTAAGKTATYDGVAVGLKMLLDKKKEIPDAKLMLFVLSDGQKNTGLSFERVKGVVEALQIPVYTIGYNMSDAGEMEKLAELNEAAYIDAETTDVANKLRLLFQVNV